MKGNGGLNSILEIVVQGQKHGVPDSAALVALVRLMPSEIANLSAQLSRLRSAHPGEACLPEWRSDLLHHLAAEIQLAFGRLLPLEPPILNLPLLAFSSRSLLELAVWAELCVRSEKNAHRFYEDRYRDALGLRSAFADLANLAPDFASGGLESALKHLEESIREAAAASKIARLDCGYMRVAEAAKTLDSTSAFLAMNRILSKFTHPTALTIFAPLPNQELTTQLGTLLKLIGTSSALVSLRLTSNFLESCNIPRPSDAPASAQSAAQGEASQKLLRP